MGRGNSGIGKRKGAAGGVATAAPAPMKTLHSKSQVGELTENYTPQMFLGDTDRWMGTMDDARYMAEDNMPKSLAIGGYAFQSMGAPTVHYVDDGKLKNNVVVMLDYQSQEKIGNEYPVLQIGVRLRRYRNKIQTEIIRDGYTYATRFW